MIEIRNEYYEDEYRDTISDDSEVGIDLSDKTLDEALSIMSTAVTECDAATTPSKCNKISDYQNDLLIITGNTSTNAFIDNWYKRQFKSVIDKYIATSTDPAVYADIAATGNLNDAKAALDTYCETQSSDTICDFSNTLEEISNLMIESD